MEQDEMENKRMRTRNLLFHKAKELSSQRGWRSGVEKGITLRSKPEENRLITFEIACKQKSQEGKGIWSSENDL